MQNYLYERAVNCWWCSWPKFCLKANALKGEMAQLYWLKIWVKVSPVAQYMCQDCTNSLNDRQEGNKKFIIVWLLLLTLCFFPATAATQSLSVWLASDYAEWLPSNWPNRNRREFQVSWLTSVTKRWLYMYINNILQGNIHIPNNRLTFPPLPRCARVVLSIVIRCLI